MQILQQSYLLYMVLICLVCQLFFFYFHIPNMYRWLYSISPSWCRRTPNASHRPIHCSNSRCPCHAGSTISRAEGGRDRDGASSYNHETHPEVSAATLWEPQPRPAGPVLLIPKKLNLLTELLYIWTEQMMSRGQWSLTGVVFRISCVVRTIRPTTTWCVRRYNSWT